MRILLVEDEAELAHLVSKELRRSGFAVDISPTGKSAMTNLEVTDYDVLVLDRGLPDMSGDDICRFLADVPERPRILMLTASGGVNDRIEGLTIGADDYMGKPFIIAELVARLRALGRRPTPGVPVVLHWADLRVDIGRHSVERSSLPIELSRKEFGVLQMLLTAHGSTVSAEQLLEKGWDQEIDPFTNVIRVTMMNLRRKLGPPSLIETVVGVGYRMSTPE